jgi:signal recognition particle GTPase
MPHLPANPTQRAGRTRRQGVRPVQEALTALLIDTVGLIARDERLLADLAKIDAVLREWRSTAPQSPPRSGGNPG